MCLFHRRLVANNIAEGGTVQTQNPSLGNAQIVLNTHAEATFQIPDVTKVLAVPDLLKLYMQPAVVAIAERIETDILSSVFAIHGERRDRDGWIAVDGGGDRLGRDHAVSGESAASAGKYLVVDPERIQY